MKLSEVSKYNIFYDRYMAAYGNIYEFRCENIYQFSPIKYNYPLDNIYRSEINSFGSHIRDNVVLGLNPLQTYTIVESTLK